MGSDHILEMISLLVVAGMITIGIVRLVYINSDKQKENKVKEANNEDGTGKYNKWVVLADSVIGKAHLEKTPPAPCQDSYYVEHISDQWGVAVVSDGLGSKPLSHIGSKFVAQKTAIYFKELMGDKEYVKNNKIPSIEEWNVMAYNVLYKVYKSLVVYASAHQYELNDLACTVIAVIYSPYGLLVTHIGDGRAGYCTQEGEWKSMIKPINGESSSEVMPITAPFWKEMKMVGYFIENNIIGVPVKAFTLMSDGSESFSYETLKWNDKEGQYDEVNLPYCDFFNPVVNYFLDKEKKYSHEEMAMEWQQFLTKGTEKIENEPDDKTLILGFVPNKEKA